jgi:peptidyl-prolyl cis-trans isomerase-like protein 2
MDLWYFLAHAFLTHKMQAIQELNIKPKNWRELLTDEPFTRNDLITIQNPNAVDSKILGEFDHVKKGLKLEDEG